MIADLHSSICNEPGKKAGGEKPQRVPTGSLKALRRTCLETHCAPCLLRVPAAARGPCLVRNEIYHRLCCQNHRQVQVVHVDYTCRNPGN
ncbi:hypothetical protein DPEC_G00338640 [Dallia pectoralis]|uniref:Uncharacterized protein n=1 Tax=Dallia pectoralis TaxID=75939 RepID=A0ACC2F4P8_DALPE|nr:hypothetical protein DPEC_G00338640 [Dallia pectoralis]